MYPPELAACGDAPHRLMIVVTDRLDNASIVNAPY
jgi:hypothetical protein